MSNLSSSIELMGHDSNVVTSVTDDDGTTTNSSSSSSNNINNDTTTTNSNNSNDTTTTISNSSNNNNNNNNSMNREEILKRLMKDSTGLSALIKFISDGHLKVILQQLLQPVQEHSIKMAVLKRMINLLTIKYTEYYYKNYGCGYVNREFIYVFKHARKVIQTHFDIKLIFNLLLNYEQSDQVNEYIITILLVLNNNNLYQQDDLYTTFKQVLINSTKSNIKLQITNDVWFTIFKHIHKYNDQYLLTLVDTLDRAFKRSKQTIGPIVAQLYNVCCNCIEILQNSTLNNILNEMFKLRNELISSSSSMIIHQVFKSSIKNEQLYINSSEFSLLDSKTLHSLFESIYLYLRVVVVANNSSIFDKEFNQYKLETVNVESFIKFIQKYLCTTPVTIELSHTFVYMFNILELLNVKQLDDNFTKIFKLEGEEITQVKKSIISFISHHAIQQLDSNLENYLIETILTSEKKKSLRPLAIYCFEILTHSLILQNKDSVLKLLQQHSKKILSFIFNKETIELLNSKDFIALSYLISNILFTIPTNEKLTKIINGSMSNAIKSDLYLACCIALSNCKEDHQAQRILSKNMLNYCQFNDNYLIEQVLLDSFNQSFIIELENETRRKLDDESSVQDKMYSHSSLRFAIETFRDCLVKCQDDTSIYKLFILMHHPCIVDNIHSLVHNEKYKHLIMNNISHNYEEMVKFLLNELLVNDRREMRIAISHSIVSLILYKHSKHGIRVFELISKELQSHSYLLFESDEYNVTDFIVYNRMNAEEPYHDLDSQVNKHPIYRQNSTLYMSEKESVKYYRYHLTDKEWEVIQNKEKTIKKNLQESRRQFVKETMLKKENIVKQSIQKQVDKIQQLLSLVLDITQLTNGDKISIDVVTLTSMDDDNTTTNILDSTTIHPIHTFTTSNSSSSNNNTSSGNSNTGNNNTSGNTSGNNTCQENVEHYIRTHYMKFPWSLLLFNITNLLDKFKYFSPISKDAFHILKNVNRNTLIHLDFANDSQPKTTTRRKNTVSNEAIAEMLAIATFRIKNMFNNESSEYEDTLTRYIPNLDSNTTFGDYIIHKIRLQFPNMLESEEFTCLLPFLESILNRQSIIGKPEHRFESSSLTTCMSILSAHAGKSDLTSVIRKKVMEICVNEVLPFIPHLNKQSFNSMMSMSPYLIDEFKPIIYSITYSEMENVRLYCLKTLCQYLSKGDLKKLSESTLDEIKFILYYSQFDTSEECKVLSKPFLQKDQFTLNLLEVIEKAIPLITCDTKFDSYYSRNNACLTITGALKDLVGGTTINKSNVQLVNSILTRVIKVFKEKQMNLDSEKSFEPLISIAWLLQEISPFARHELKLLFDFIVNDGFKHVETQLEKSYQELLDEMVSIGLALVFNHGKEDTNSLIDLFDGYINQLQKTSNDFATATVVVWYGSVSKYFNPQTNIQKIKKAIDQLVDTLVIPSNSVQKSISEALSPLISNIYDKEQDYIHNELINRRLLSFLLYGTSSGSGSSKSTPPNSYGVKRGFAWGFAGVLYGCGLLDLYQYAISPINQYLTNNKADKKGKEGCMLALECISHRFQNTFEPYIVEVMPVVLNYALSDPSKEVRSSAEQAVSSILSQLTPYGVVQLLPSVIQPTSNDNWRQKAANIKLLGHMAYCAPRQLSSYLPTIIKLLKESVNETHPDIVEASKRSLERVGGASRSPEISKQVPLLLDALTNPDQKTIDKVLESLLFTRFTHSIDSASLALLMPVLTRALNERYTDIKKKACQIIGSISALILDPKRDLFPYMVDLIPILKNILVDPNPQVRASSAKAIGQLCKSVGEDNLTGVMSWLHEKLIQQGDEYVTERSGAAQALCEVIAAQGVSRLQKSLPTLLSQIDGDNVQEGYMQVFVYLPALMKSQFEPFLEMCLPKILKALSHSKEGIRETSLQSSRVIVELFTDSAMNILVPALREGLESEEWRTRYNCLILLTDLLTRMTTLYGNSDEMNHLDDNPIQLSVIERVLSLELVSHIIALTFIAIQDINLKSIANKLWKDMVANTPSTLKNHLNCITDCILKHLNMSEDQRFIAGKALGELVVKLGERVVGELIPMLHQQLLDVDSNPEKRQGVILGVTELMLAASDKHLQTYSIKLIQIVKRGICDDDSTVRDAASQAFDVLCRVMGDRSVKEIVQQLLQDLEKSNEKIVEIAASGMQQLVRVRPQNVLPKLIPALLSTSNSSNGLLTDTQLKTLGDVCESVYENDHLEEMNEFILPMIEKLITQLSISPYIDSVTNVSEESILILRTITKVLECLDIQESYTIFELVSNHMTSNDIKMRRAANLFMQIMFNPNQYNEDNLSEDFINDELLPIYEQLITSFNDPDDNVVKCAWHAVDKLINKCLSKEVHYNDFIQPTRENIRKLTQVSSTGELISIDLPAFNKITKGIEPILNLYLHGLLFGKSPESRENSALGIGDLICMTSAKQLSPYVIKITGPLIRVAGDRFPWSVKAAILQTCSSLMDKGSIMLKPFLPQLQATFIKGLQDSSASILRRLSEQSIPKLIDLGCRVDSLVSALNVALKANALSGKGSVNDFVISISRTLTLILTLACDQDKVKGVPFDQCIDTLKKTLALSDSSECANSILTKQAVQQDSDRILDITSQCLSICARGLHLQKDNTIIQFINDTIHQSDNLYVTFIVMAYWAVDKTLSPLILDKVKEKIIAISQTTNSTPQFAKISISLTKAATLIIINNDSCATDLLPVVKSQFEKASQSQANALRYEVAKCIKKLIKSYREKYQTEKMFDFVDPLIQMGIKDKFIPAKLCNERSLFYLLGFADNDHLRSISEYCSFKKLGSKDSKFIEDYGAKVLMKLSPEDSDLEAEEEEEERFYE